MSLNRLIFFTVWLLLAALALPASAQEPADVDAARKLFIEGSKLSKQGDWLGARGRFERSLALKQAPITLYSLAVAQLKTEQLTEALENFRAFRHGPVEPSIKNFIEPAEKAIAELEKRVAYLTIVVTPGGVPGAAVKLDGVEVPPAALSVPRMVNPGKRELVASAPGRAHARRIIELAEGGRETVRLQLLPLANANNGNGSSNGGGSNGGGSNGSGNGANGSSSGGNGANSNGANGNGAHGGSGLGNGNGSNGDGDAAAGDFPTSAVVLMSVGGAAFVAGLSVGLVGYFEAQDAPTRNGDEAEAARSKALAGDIVAGTGAAMAAIGLVMLLVDLAADDDGEPASASAVRVAPWSSGSTAGLSVAF